MAPPPTLLRHPIREHTLRPYALALGLASGAVALQWAIHPLVGARVPFLFFLPAVMLAAAWLGRGPALLVALAGFVNAQVLLPPTGSLRVDDPMDQAAAFLYFGVATAVAIAGGYVRELAERARVAERRLVLAVAETGIGVFDVDLEHGTAYVSPSFASFVGLPVSESPVPLARWLASLPPEVAEESRRQITRRLREHATGYEREVPLRRPDGSPLWTLMRVHVVWERERAVRLRGTVVDITERKRTEGLMQEADRRKDEFLATLAHELRNPLAPIRQATMTARSTAATEAERRWSHEVIDRQVRHMALLLDDLLDVSRITRGVLSLHKGPADLAAVVDNAVETAQPLVAARQQVLTVDLPVPSPRFEADALRVSQVLANLLTNAAKYTPPRGHIRLAARREGGELVIAVTDDGIGIAPESLPHVFDMFTQLGRRVGAAPSAVVGEGGLGIGLALARALVGLHGGTLAADSAGPGRGSVFTVRLPAGEATAVPAASVPVPAETPQVPRRVLVADDNRDAADSLAMLLRLSGHQVVLAYDGEAAVDAWSREHPDVCFLDIGMPGRDGNDVARAIRRLPGGERPLLVAITGWGQSTDRRRALSAGFDEHVTKPVDPDELLRLLARRDPAKPAEHRAASA